MKPSKRAAGAQSGRTQEERSRETVSSLLEAARKLFAAKGFAKTSLEDILGQTHLTRGALYHHFANKIELFRAVVEEQEKVLMATIAAAASRQLGAWENFIAGCRAFLEACLDPATQRIILIDAPAVIGWGAMREIESRYALALLRQGLERAIAEKALSKRPVAPLAHFMLGALSESAMAIAKSPNPKATMRETQAELQRLLTALALVQ